MAIAKGLKPLLPICALNGRKVPKDEWHKAKFCPFKVVLDNVKLPLKIPTLTRLRAQNKMTYKKGVPVREEKPRILSCVAGEPIVWVNE